MDLNKVKKQVAALETSYSLATTQAADEEETLAKARKTLACASIAQQIAQSVAQHIQQQAHKRIASVVSKCLESIFEEPYEFQINFEQKRGRTEAELTLIRNGVQFDDPTNQTGGGVIDIASFALRLANLLLSKPPVRKTLFLDEPFRFVSAEYRARVRQMLETLSREMGVQFIIVTHIEELRTGAVIELG